MAHDVEEIGAKMNALDIWPSLVGFNWAVKPLGTVFPYFCTTLVGDRRPVKVRFLMLEGWQTLHDFVRMHGDRDFGVSTSPIEFPHLELVVLESGEMKLFRHDTGFMPVEASAVQRQLAARILWEAYGVMLRIESDPKLPLKYLNETAVFARIERTPDGWEDAPLAIPPPPPYVEKVRFEKKDIQCAKDLPFGADDVLHVDFRLMPHMMTRDSPRPRCVYQLIGVDAASKKPVIDMTTSVRPEIGLKGMWEAMPAQLLKAIIARGKVPGELRVRSGRVFRLLRPLCLELPFKLSMHDKLEGL